MGKLYFAKINIDLFESENSNLKQLEEKINGKYFLTFKNFKNCLNEEINSNSDLNDLDNVSIYDLPNFVWHCNEIEQFYDSYIFYFYSDENTNI